MLRLQFVYVMTGELGFVKIGICRPPEFPADALKTGSIRPLEIVWVVATNGDAHEIELDAHRILGSSRHSDEWFAIPVESAIKAVERAARDLDYPLLSVGPLNGFAKPLKRLGPLQMLWFGGMSAWARALAITCIGLAAGGAAFYAMPQVREAVSKLFRLAY